jgi:hypothetical protein
VVYFGVEMYGAIASFHRAAAGEFYVSRIAKGLALNQPQWGIIKAEAKIMSDSLETVLEAALNLPQEEQRQLAERLPAATQLTEAERLSGMAGDRR